MLEIRGLDAFYGEAQALHAVDITVGEGEVVTLVGRNGAGKTTLLRSIMGLHRDVRGSVTLAGKDLTRTPAHQRARLGLGWVQDDRGIYASLNVEENLTLPPVTHVDSAWSLRQVYDAFPVLADRRRAPGTTLSGGEQQMLAVARVLRTGARVLLLDEPSEGLAPVIVQRIRDIVLEVKQRGSTVLLVEQNVAFAASVADRHYVLAEGTVAADLDNAEFTARQGELLEYLGM
ncbi:ABC transporter ATP-binding protein [Ornithinimicrobium pekingense]|uniref:ABC transporter ATP-binding protein n=1 Tax=Ornithinimicrobium pekingense TaxID=384677 RepID=A0ABQ2F7Y6_9MICO|nr:ABC transporter ATP-binding protein [Ornithinimicrobium pekingense]GGK70197.1 ABC transporter ATP-binding protein [Ornithinimicrobium pekingense]